MSNIVCRVSQRIVGRIDLWKEPKGLSLHAFLCSASIGIRRCIAWQRQACLAPVSTGKLIRLIGLAPCCLPATGKRLPVELLLPTVNRPSEAISVPVVLRLLVNSKLTSQAGVLPLLFGIAFHLLLVLLSYHPIFLRLYHSLKLVSFLRANRTKSASVCLWLLRGAI